MLSQSTIAIIKSTVPVLEQNGELLTRHFYQRMFKHNPEVLPFFNQANQAGGGSQQKALAAAICAYAANIDRLDALGGAVELIAQKHASLKIRPEHYPIVGENLLASIREVLGAGAIDEVIAAWGEAYGLLAGVLGGRESQIYHEHRTTHGWDGFKPFRVLRKEKESEIITSFYLAPADGEPAPGFKPGQYVTIRVPGRDGLLTMRNYSLSGKPGQPWFRISVKREAAADARTLDGIVSNFLHRDVQPGDTIEVGPPCGEFVLDLNGSRERPLVFLSGGVGITPVLSMLEAALAQTPERRMVFIHAAINGRTHAFRETVRELAARHPNLQVHYRYNAPEDGDRERGHCDSTGLVDGALIESFVPDHDADYYFCGPKPFMVAVYRLLKDWNVPSAQVRLEFFAPRQDLEQKAA